MDFVFDGDNLLGLTLVSIVFIGVLSWIFALMSVIRNEFPGENEKVMWAFILVLLPVIGTILYFAIGARRIRRW